MKKTFFLWIAAPFAIVVFILTTSCGNNNALQEKSKIHPCHKLQHIEISGIPKETELISSATDVFSLNGKQFKINYKIKVFGNPTLPDLVSGACDPARRGKDFYSDELELVVNLETSFLNKREKNFTEIADSKSAGTLSVKITQPGLGQNLSVSVCPSSILNWNKKPTTLKDLSVARRLAEDTYIVNYLMSQKDVWEEVPRTDGYLYGRITFLMESKGSVVSSGKEETEIDKYFRNVSFHVTVRKK